MNDFHSWYELSRKAPEATGANALQFSQLQNSFAIGMRKKGKIINPFLEGIYDLLVLREVLSKQGFERTSIACGIGFGPRDTFFVS